MRHDRRRGTAAAIGAAVLFGASAPLAKRLVGHAGVLALSCLLYVGAAVTLTIASALRRGLTPEARVRRSDLPLLGVVSVLGGMVGPWLLLAGLSRVRGTAGALLLNLEGPLTLALAVLVFGEHASRRVVVGSCAIFAGAAVVMRDPGPSSAALGGSLAVAGACLAWAIDNNLTQRLSLRDPLQLVQAKAAVAAVGSGLLAVGTHSHWPAMRYAVAAIVLGGAAYGASIVLDVVALRLLGAAREAAWFSSAPFIGAVLAIFVLGERLRLSLLVAAVAMVAGVWVLVREDHVHTHVHQPVEHDHVHSHDTHHDHRHEPAPVEPHSHLHRHAVLRHAHPHVSDVHHRHPH